MLEGTVNPRGRDEVSGQIFVITHVDVDPQFVDQGPSGVRYIRERQRQRSRRPDVRSTQPVADPEPLSAHRGLRKPAGIRRPRDAQHTLSFRDDLQPFIGVPYDERLYQFADR